jgi:biopolymer transport protein ExbD
MGDNRNRRKESDPCQVNISPMIDMVFILLIFFVVTAVFVEDFGFEADTPDSTPPIVVVDTPVLGLHLDSSSRIFFEGNQISFDSVQAKVAQNRVADSDTAVIVHAQALTNAGFLVEVLDQVRLGGVEVVSLALDAD